MSLLMGIDIGTSSVKSMVMDLSGKVLGFAQTEYDIAIPVPGYAEQNPDEWWELVKRTSAEAIMKAGVDGGAIEGIGFSGQMHGLVALDKEGQVLRPSIIWCDQRTIPQKNMLESRFTPEQLGNMIQNSVSTGFLILSLMWIKENEPDLYNRIDRVMLPKDYVRYRLTGEIGTDTTDASGTSAFHASSLEWSEPLITMAGMDSKLFPPVGNPWEIAGYVTKQAESESCFKAGTPVVFGGADQAMQAVGNGIIEPGDLSVTIGTGGQLFTTIDQPVYDKKLRTHTYAHAVPSRWYLLGATMSAGLSLKWLASQVLKVHDYKALDRKANEVSPGSNGLLFLPYLTGDRTPHMDPQASGMFFGLRLDHNDTHLIRAVLEGVCYSLRDGVEIIRSLEVDLRRIIISGGGAKSPLWSQILADILNQDVYVSTTEEQACVGAAIMAGVGVKLYSSVEQGCKTVVKLHENPIRPNAGNHAVYDRQYAVYSKLYEHNKDIFPMLNTITNESGVLK
ncbi:xylulokinase [Paenibacillus glycanilyticus]|uniref:Xylulose kinase n=1 Tax=Paenibacillus glycanilyticus TaxID=126569 RepID=A0ABQ6GNE4_9BACL|nr:xylulokinase [Paenibacillus glycanilyticus]GLX70968.1 xylulokinase [Paenibacillus glycanilyticus]